MHCCVCLATFCPTEHAAHLQPPFCLTNVHPLYHTVTALCRHAARPFCLHTACASCLHAVRPFFTHTLCALVRNNRLMHNCQKTMQQRAADDQGKHRCQEIVILKRDE
eukprot:1141678-Pelagomonas_calceolata.AAC.2